MWQRLREGVISLGDSDIDIDLQISELSYMTQFTFCRGEGFEWPQYDA